MAVELAVPITIAPDAAEWVAELGIAHAVDRVLVETARIMPGLKKLDVTIEPTYDLDDEYAYWLIVACHGDRSRDEVREAMQTWYAWRAENLPIDTGRHFIPDWIGPGDAHEG